MKVYIIFGGYEWEGSRILRVYQGEQTAQLMLKRLEKHKSVEPKCNDIDPNSPEVKAWCDKHQAWTNKCPIKDAAGFDYYNLGAYDVMP